MITTATCIATVLINLTGVWNDQDQQTLDRAKQRCASIYEDAPCLKRFVKKEEDTYNAICGEESIERYSWIKDSH